jgi:hypothetical protein
MRADLPITRVICVAHGCRPLRQVGVRQPLELQRTSMARAFLHLSEIPDYLCPDNAHWRKSGLDLLATAFDPLLTDRALRRRTSA